MERDAYEREIELLKSKNTDLKSIIDSKESVSENMKKGFISEYGFNYSLI